MEFTMRRVEKDEKEILRNLLEKYDYEFSQWDDRDVDKLGLFGYDYLDCYWTEEKRFAYFFYVDGKLAGFAMVNDYPEVEDVPCDYTMAEFCILFKYRRKGIGTRAAKEVFDQFHGKWQLLRHPKNTPSIHFWNRVVEEYTGGNYQLVEGYLGTEYDDGTPGDVFFFEN